MWSIALALILVVGLIGPWPVNHDEYADESYAQTTFARISQTAGGAFEGPLAAGVGVAEITPPPGVPLAGYAGRKPKDNTGARDRLFAKALSLSNGQHTVTLVSGDFLLPLPELTEAILARTGLSRDQIYFSATHTHSGPGGYAHGAVAHFALGEFQQPAFDLLLSGLSTAIIASRANMQPASIDYKRLALPRALSDNLILHQLAPSEIGHNTVHVLRLHALQVHAPLAALITFSAHPTFLGKANRRASGDYPALLQAHLEQRWGGTVIFAAGAVGGMLPVGKGDKPSDTLEGETQRMENMAQQLAQLIGEVGDQPRTSETGPIISAQWRAQSTSLVSALVPIELPSPTYRLSENLRLSPFFVSKAFHDRQTYIHAVRIGPLVLIGMPGDFSGELAMQLEPWGDRQGLMTWVTDFNGDFIGYAMPQKRYANSHYTTRDANFYGPWAGEYLLDAAQRLADRLRQQ